MQAVNKLSSNVFNKSFRVMADVDPLDLLAQELGFALKSEQREALQSLLRGNDVFCVLPTAKVYSSYQKILLSVKIRHLANNT